MATAIKAVYEDGVFKPKEPVSLEEHAEVEVLISRTVDASQTTYPTLQAWRRLKGFIKETPPDEAIGRDHDKYLYR